MAATDVKDVYIVTKPNGEQWIVKKLCNGDIIDVVRLCGCGQSPDDPGTSPDPIVDTEACRIANGIGQYIQGRANYFATLLGEQPDNDFGSFAVALTWLTSTYGPFYPAQLWDATRQLAIDYNDTDEGMLGDGIPNTSQYLACAAYQAIQADVNGINLSPDFAENFSTILIEFTADAPNADVEYSLPFISRVVELITLAQYKRVAFEASTKDPTEEGDLECDTCFPDPEEGVCTEEAYIWNLVDATPSGWAQVGTLPMVDLGNLSDEAGNCLQLNATRSPFGYWTNANIPGHQCIGVKRTFSSPCTLNHVSTRFQSDTGGTKWAAIYCLVGSTWIMLNGFYQSAPAPNQWALTWTGTMEDVSEVHFIGGSGHPSADLNLKVLGNSINTTLPPQP